MNTSYQYFIETKDKYKDILVKVTSNTYYNVNRRMKTLLFEHEVVIAPDCLIVAAKLNGNLDNLVLCETCGGTGETMRMVCYGNEPYEKIDKCPDCNGEGVLIER